MSPSTRSQTAAGKAASPTSVEVEERLRELARRYPRRARLRLCGRSREGRPIRALVLTDPRVPARDKQHAVIVGGRHGNEESGRLVALGLAEHLLGPAGRTTLARQVVAVVPNANPDACERDIYATPGGTHVCFDLDRKRPIPETAALHSLVGRMQPELLVDLHARGFAGCGADMVLYPVPRRYTEDDNLFHQAAAEMCAAGEAAGLPHFTHPLAWWSKKDNGACYQYYRRYKSLALLTETSESNGCSHAAALRVRCGVARLMAALHWGNVRHPWLYHPGYPNQLVIGSRHLGIAARGRTAAARRRCRVEIWRQADKFEALKFVIPQADREKVVLLDYRGPELDTGCGILLTTRHARGPREVFLQGRRLRRSPERGYVAWRVGRLGAVMVALPRLRRGHTKLVLRF